MRQFFAALFIIALGLILFSAAVHYQKRQYHYVKGLYGSICYEVGQQNKNIHFPIYYKTLDDCEAHTNDL